MTDFFTVILGNPIQEAGPGVDPQALQEVLHHQSDRLVPSEKAALNAPLTLDELGDATRALANDKCPGPDGAPAEFFKVNWHTVGPLVMDCLTEGIGNEHMPAFITRGAILLLPKKADQKLLVNKRPITLPNTCYKIGAKAFQRCLSPILQRIISYQQSAFLPGRNIHHSLLLVGEMLHQAKKSGEEHILMKLDILKAFDRLEWGFVLAVIERVGLAGLLSQFLRSGFHTAASHVILNGRPTQAFSLAWSMRQGCPLSPLVFILAFDSLTHVFSYAMERRAIVGVHFPKLNRSNLLSTYADDFIIITRAQMGFIMEIKRTLQVFGAA